MIAWSIAHSVMTILPERFLRRFYAPLSQGYGSLSRRVYPALILPPLRILLLLTTRCNLSCPYCIARDGLNVPETDRLTLHEWKRVVDSIPRGTVVSLEGGEPFLFPEIMELLDMLLASRRRVTAVTNGTALTPERVTRLVQGGLLYLGVSIDGMEDYHNRVRGHPQAFQRSTAALRMLRDEKARLNSARPVTCVKTCLTSDNYEEIPRLLQYVEDELAVEDFRINFLVANPILRVLQPGLVESMDDPAFQVGNTFVYEPDHIPRIQEALRFVFERQKRSRMTISFDPEMSEADALAYVENPARFGVRRCSLPLNEFTIHYNGDVSPCLSLRVDNLRALDYDVRRIVGHPRYREFLARHFARMPGARACQGCVSMRHTAQRGDDGGAGR